MSLYPGAPRLVETHSVLDDTALQDSMALAMDNAMKQLYQDLKGKVMPDSNPEDRRMLFTAIARGILQYLNDHQGVLRASVTVDGTATTYTVRNFNLDVTMNGFTPDA